MKIMVMIGSNVLGEIIIMKNAEHEGGKLVRVVMLKDEAGLAILNEIRHLITVSTNTRKSKGERQGRKPRNNSAYKRHHTYCNIWLLR